MKLDELKEKIREILPCAQFEFDNSEQVVIYTDCQLNEDESRLIPPLELE